MLFVGITISIQADIPNVCGQGPENIPIEDLYASAAAFQDGVTVTDLTLDGESINDLHRIQSSVFEVALPEENVFVDVCGGFPGGIYSPVVTDGHYVSLHPLAVGNHTLHFHVENPDVGFVSDVTYHLTVVPVVQEHGGVR